MEDEEEEREGEDKIIDPGSCENMRKNIIFLSKAKDC